MTRTALAVAAALLAGCALKPFTLTQPFDEEQARRQLAGSHKAEVRMTARIRGLDATDPSFTCAGEPAYLMPATPMAKEWVKYVYGQVEGGPLQKGMPFDESLPIFRFIKTTTCGPEGDIRFDGVGDGEWYVLYRIPFPGGRGPRSMAAPLSLRNGKMSDTFDGRH